MNEQNNNVFGNVQPNVVPEVKNSGDFGQTTSGGMVDNIANSNIVQPNPVPGIVTGDSQLTAVSSNGIVQNSDLDTNVGGENISNSTSGDLSFNLPSTAATTSNVTIGLNDNMVNDSVISNDVVASVATEVNTIENNNIVTENGVSNNDGLVGNAVGVGMSSNNQTLNSGLDKGNIQAQQNIKNETSSNENMAPVVPVKKYLGYMLLPLIPVVGGIIWLIMMIVKALDKKDKNISNYAKAQLLLTLISTVVAVIIFVFITFLFAKTIPQIGESLTQQMSGIAEDSVNEYIDDYDMGDIDSNDVSDAIDSIYGDSESDIYGDVTDTISDSITDSVVG